MAGFAGELLAERLRMTEDEVRNSINECREKGIRRGDVALNAMIMMDYTVPEMIQETGWTVDEVRIYMDRGAKLKVARETAGLSPGEVAQRLGVSLREITWLEAGNYGDEPLLKSLGDVINTLCDL